MFCEPTAGALQIWAPAKVNLFLEVLGKRPDGYHELATLMVAVGLYDTLHLREDSSGAVTLTCDTPTLSAGPDNLVVRAAELLRRNTGTARGAAIRLVKRIPLAAGLAGGSTDAAAALVGLNRLWRLDLPTAELVRLAAELGSDVPFFLGGPAGWCTGRGERVEPAACPKSLWLVLICPPEGLSTAAVYRGVTPAAEPVDGTPLRTALASGDVEAVGRRLHNRLQPPAERLSPAVAAWADRLRRLPERDVAGTLMSGSGSTLFALCRGRAEAGRTAHLIHQLAGPAGGRTDPGPRVLVVRSLDVTHVTGATG